MQALFANPQDEVVQKATQAACVEHKKREIFAALEYAFKRAAESERAIAAYAVHALYDVEVLDHDDIEIYYTSLRGDAELKKAASAAPNRCRIPGSSIQGGDPRPTSPE